MNKVIVYIDIYKIDILIKTLFKPLAAFTVVNSSRLYLYIFTIYIVSKQLYSDTAYTVTAFTVLRLGVLLYITERILYIQNTIQKHRLRSRNKQYYMLERCICKM